MARLRIVFLIENVSILRDRRVRNESAALVWAGHEVSVICPRLKSEPHFPNWLGGARICSYPQPWQGSSRLTYCLEYAWGMVATSILLIN
ncbi:MAG TPA: hypothetical protein VKT29_02790, partial [Terriglobales bacterium]|nr:hypothetical protein [Terriglobales bacterium]